MIFSLKINVEKSELILVEKVDDRKELALNWVVRWGSLVFVFGFSRKTTLGKLVSSLYG